MKTYLSLMLLFLSITSFAQQKDSLNTVSDKLKNKVIKYHVNKLAGGGKEIAGKRTEVTISQENINLYSEASGRVVDFNTIITDKEWYFNKDLSKGYAIYKGYIKRDNGTTDKTAIKIEADENGKLRIYDPEADKESILIMYVDSFTIIK